MRHLITALLFVSFVGCSASNVSYDYNKDASFTGLRTYDWLNISRPLQADAVFVDRFKQAVQADLLSKGFIRSTKSPDFVISLHRSVEMRRDYINGNYPYGIYGGYRHHHRPFMSQYMEEIMYINFYKAGTKDLIWHAARAARHVRGLTPADNEQKANKAADEIMKNFPSAMAVKK